MESRPRSFPQGQIPLFGGGAEIFLPTLLKHTKKGAEYLIKNITSFGVCPVCPQRELFPSGAEPYYFEFHQGHI